MSKCFWCPFLRSTKALYKLDVKQPVLFHYSCPMANVLERLFVTDPILERQKVKVDDTSVDKLFISLF